jgi:very-short-patch-repair endonuclease
MTRMANSRARYLRQHLTPREVKLWVHPRAWRRTGFHFRRQAPRGPYVVDFVELRHRLIVELDGSGHARHYQSIRDRVRDRQLSDEGFQVLRFWNSEVDANLPLVLDTIHAALTMPVDPTPGLRPDPPRTGEG